MRSHDVDSYPARQRSAAVAAISLHVVVLIFAPPVVSRPPEASALVPTRSTPPHVVELKAVSFERPAVPASVARPADPLDVDLHEVEDPSEPPDLELLREDPWPGDRGPVSAGPGRGRPLALHQGSPVILQQVQPEYPDVARRAEAEGTVVVRVRIDERGLVTEAEVWRSEVIGVLEDAALRAAREWRFRPARQNGRPVATWATLAFAFRIDR